MHPANSSLLSTRPDLALHAGQGQCAGIWGVGGGVVTATLGHGERQGHVPHPVGQACSAEQDTKSSDECDPQATLRLWGVVTKPEKGDAKALRRNMMRLPGQG